MLKKRQRVLVCAHSNKAVQVIASRLLKKHSSRGLVLLGVGSKVTDELKSIFHEHASMTIKNAVHALSGACFGRHTMLDQQIRPDSIPSKLKSVLQNLELLDILADRHNFSKQTQRAISSASTAIVALKRSWLCTLTTPTLSGLTYPWLIFATTLTRFNQAKNNMSGSNPPPNFEADIIKCRREWQRYAGKWLDIDHRLKMVCECVFKLQKMLRSPGDILMKQATVVFATLCTSGRFRVANQFNKPGACVIACVIISLGKNFTYCVMDRYVDHRRSQSSSRSSLSDSLDHVPTIAGARRRCQAVASHSKVS